MGGVFVVCCFRVCFFFLGGVFFFDGGGLLFLFFYFFFCYRFMCFLVIYVCVCCFFPHFYTNPFLVFVLVDACYSS